MTGKSNLSRRQFLSRAAGTAAGAVALPYFVPASVLGQTGSVAPSNRITLGFIGAGGMGTYNMRGFMSNRDVQVLAVCDVVKGSDQYGHWYKSNDHKRDFLDCIRTRREPITPVEVGHRSASVCHLANITMLLKEKLRWDPDKERFVNNEQANRMLSRPMRSPWHL